MKVAFRERQRYGATVGVDILCGPRKLYRQELMHTKFISKVLQREVSQPIKPAYTRHGSRRVRNKFVVQRMIQLRKPMQSTVPHSSPAIDDRAAWDKVCMKREE